MQKYKLQTIITSILNAYQNRMGMASRIVYPQRQNMLYLFALPNFFFFFVNYKAFVSNFLCDLIWRSAYK